MTPSPRQTLLTVLHDMPDEAFDLLLPGMKQMILTYNNEHGLQRESKKALISLAIALNIYVGDIHNEYVDLEILQQHNPTLFPPDDKDKE